jgi:hypothetical protein
LWSELTETALVIIPEEADLLIPIVRDEVDSGIYLLTYAAPVTRNMLHFNGLRYLTVPPLPEEWEAPNWLTIELGILAGRVYFEFEEYDALRRFLGVNSAREGLRSLDGTMSSSKPSDMLIDEATDKSVVASQSFTTKPLIFLQEWLAIRRKGGQDFSQTPMGYVCQEKSLAANHPFFRKDEGGGASHSSFRIGRSNGSVRANADSDSGNVFASNECPEDEDIYGDKDEE